MKAQGPEQSVSGEDLVRRTNAAVGAATMLVGPHRRRALKIGACVGIVLVAAVAGYRIYDRAMMPPVPALESAPPEEVVSFIANPRGMSRLSRFDQDNFVTMWKAHYGRDEPRRALREHLEQCDDERRAAVREALFKVRKRQFLQDAAEFLRIREDRSAGYQFLSERLAAIAADTAWVRGDGDPQRDLTGVMGGGLPRNPDDWMRLIVSETTPEERVVGEQYVGALREVYEQVRKRQRPAGNAAAEGT